MIAVGEHDDERTAARVVAENQPQPLQGTSTCLPMYLFADSASRPAFEALVLPLLATLWAERSKKRTSVGNYRGTISLALSSMGNSILSRALIASMTR
eukprot:984899-Prymnesium_polylepis.1